MTDQLRSRPAAQAYRSSVRNPIVGTYVSSLPISGRLDPMLVKPTFGEEIVPNGARDFRLSCRPGEDIPVRQCDLRQGIQYSVRIADGCAASIYPPYL